MSGVFATITATYAKAALKHIPHAESSVLGPGVIEPVKGMHQIIEGLDIADTPNANPPPGRQQPHGNEQGFTQPHSFTAAVSGGQPRGHYIRVRPVLPVRSKKQAPTGV